MSIALLTGITGQDGSYLAEFLLKKGYEVHGIVRRHSNPHYPNLHALLDQDAIRLHEADLTDARSLHDTLAQIRPDELYNLAAQSHVGTSFTQPETTMQVTGWGAIRVFEAVRQASRHTRVYQASSSEMYGNTVPQANDGRLTETDKFQAVSPYGAAKVFAHDMARIYRAYDLYISCGILFNHESTRRGPLFVTRKITRGLARIHHKLQDTLELGNLDSIRDWGYAPDYVEAMWSMLQQDQPSDYVVATGTGHTVQHFLETAARQVLGSNWKRHVRQAPQHRRPTEIHRLVGNPTRAHDELKWQATTDLDALIHLMIQHDLQLAREESDAR